jgi:D-alanine-D-alanine ligase
LRLNTCVVFGGMSVEHEVSIITASQFMENMNQIKYNPIPIYITKNNEFYYDKNMKNVAYFKNLDVENKATKVEFIKKGNRVHLYGIKNKKLKQLFEIDLVVLSVHGTNCEDGTLSAYFDFLNLPYIGSSLLASSISQNKITTKVLLENSDLPVVPYTFFDDMDYQKEQESVIDRCEALGYPLIIKPASLGSSVGVSRCDNREELITSINDALKYDATILVEKAIVKMKEYNCAVYGNKEKQITSRIEEVLKQDKILSYQDKYLSGSKSGKGIVNTKRQIPADLDENQVNQIESLASQTFKVVGNSGVSRIDFIYDEEEDIIYINEINTIPGSFAYYLWEHEKLPYTKLIDELVRIALKNYKLKENKTFTYDTNLLSLSHANKKLKK